jgi:SAM-dependent methyltransferase
MNPSLPDTHASIQYYDSDYPSRELSVYPENFDDVVPLQGLAHDVDKYLALAGECGGPVLELCCGSGRVAIPLARAGYGVTAADISSGMLDLLRARLSREPQEVATRVRPVQQDITRLDLGEAHYPLALIPFNSLLCIPDFDAQCRAIESAARYLSPGGLLALDLVNPLALPLAGDATPRPFFTRRNSQTGNTYTRFAAMGPFGGDQKQRLYGWYDEIFPDGTVHRTDYSMEWRPIFRYELELMLDRAGLSCVSVEGGHCGKPFTAGSRKLFAIARKRGQQ